MSDLICSIEPCDYERGGRCTYPKNLSGCTHAPVRQQAEKETIEPVERPAPQRARNKRRRR